MSPAMLLGRPWCAVCRKTVERLTILPSLGNTTVAVAYCHGQEQRSELPHEEYESADAAGWGHAFVGEAARRGIPLLLPDPMMTPIRPTRGRRM